ncbi:MAG: hypothetical protein CYPHOPRED_000487 [Cyphobasidiales sp. Tagirdzhanova-0007]|nr:MAG: hypothetical protein CYPHOPRED_000487 [Cyphobasidiales sp. Tagirdzhanova-0007]
MESLKYLRVKVLVALLRIMVYLTRGIYTERPSAPVLQIPSREKGRLIKAFVYEKSELLYAAKPKPVLLNFHGGGFIFHFHGMDVTFCSLVSEQTGYIVLDIKYGLGPEQPFPAGLNDAEDAIRYVLSRPNEYDASRIALSGFSTGANIASAAAVALFEKPVIDKLIAFYPLIDLAKDPAQKLCPDLENGKPMPTWMANLMKSAYVPSGIDARDPRVSPAMADTSKYPQNVLIVTAALDNLAPEGEELGRRLEQSGKRHVVLKRFDGCVHGWDKWPKSEHDQAARDEANQLVVDFLLRD